MSEASRGLGTSAEQNKVVPDYFGFYTHEVAELLSKDEDFLPFSSQTSNLAGRTRGVVSANDTAKHNYNGKETSNFTGSSLFCDVIGAGLSDFKKERLKVLLRQSVVALTQEVDEMLDPVVAMHRIQSHLRCKKSLSSYSGAPCEGDAGHHPHKKLKKTSSSSSISIPLHASPACMQVSGEDSICECIDVVVPGIGISNGVEKKCAHCHKTETSKWRTVPEGLKGKESLSTKEQKRESYLGSNIGAEKENEEVNDDLQFLLENDGLKVEETMKKYSDELSTTLGHMERRLEELLDTVMSSCRLMTRAEKQQLRKLIQKLPPRNLDHVVEIIRRCNPSENCSSNEIHVNLDEEDNATLWRLYYYVETVENARELPL